MSPKLNLAEDPLPNPFAEGDAARDRLEQCEILIADQENRIRMLTQATTLLLTLCNNKMTATAEKKKQ